MCSRWVNASLLPIFLSVSSLESPLRTACAGFSFWQIWQALYFLTRNATFNKAEQLKLLTWFCHFLPLSWVSSKRMPVGLTAVRRMLDTVWDSHFTSVVQVLAAVLGACPAPQILQLLCYHKQRISIFWFLGLAELAARKYKQAAKCFLLASFDHCDFPEVRTMRELCGCGSWRGCRHSRHWVVKFRYCSYSHNTSVWFGSAVNCGFVFFCLLGGF